MYEYHSCNEAEALAVSSVFIRHSVGMQDVGQGLLASTLLHSGEVRVGGECATWSERERDEREEEKEREREGEREGERGEKGRGRERESKREKIQSIFHFFQTEQLWFNIFNVQVYTCRSDYPLTEVHTDDSVIVGGHLAELRQ